MKKYVCWFDEFIHNNGIPMGELKKRGKFFFGLRVVVVAFHLVFHPEFLWVDTCYCHIGLFVLLAEPLLTPAGLTMFLKFQKSEKKFKEVFKFVFGIFFH